jgi:hypothetical protein
MSMAEMAKPALPSSTLRSYATIGIVLYAFGVLLNEIGNGLTQLWLVPFADTISALGFVVAVYAASLSGVGTRLTVLLGLIYGVGTFYVSEPDATYAASGLKIGSYSHDVGLGLIGFTLLLLIALSFYLTRTMKPKAVSHRIDAGAVTQPSPQVS